MVFFGSKYIFLNKSTDSEESFQKIESTDNNLVKENEDDDEIYVHICGRVKKPGLIKINKDSRVIDAVNEAGGLYEDADIDKINLAKKLSDEDRIFIPKVGEEISGIVTFNSNESSKIININTATKEELQNLPGVGPKTADNIISYREENSFGKIEDIMNVQGIGDKKFKEIEKFISVN